MLHECFRLLTIHFVIILYYAKAVILEITVRYMTAKITHYDKKKVVVTHKYTLTAVVCFLFEPLSLVSQINHVY